MKKSTFAVIALLVLSAFGGLVILYPMMFNSVNDTAPVSLPEPQILHQTPPSPQMQE